MEKSLQAKIFTRDNSSFLEKQHVLARKQAEEDFFNEASNLLKDISFFLFKSPNIFFLIYSISKLIIIIIIDKLALNKSSWYLRTNNTTKKGDENSIYLCGSPKNLVILKEVRINANKDKNTGK